MIITNYNVYKLFLEKHSQTIDTSDDQEENDYQFSIDYENNVYENYLKKLDESFGKYIQWVKNLSNSSKLHYRFAPPDSVASGKFKQSYTDQEYNEYVEIVSDNDIIKYKDFYNNFITILHNLDFSNRVIEFCLNEINNSNGKKEEYEAFNFYINMILSYYDGVKNCIKEISILANKIIKIDVQIASKKNITTIAFSAMLKDLSMRMCEIANDTVNLKNDEAYDLLKQKELFKNNSENAKALLSLYRHWTPEEFFPIGEASYHITKDRSSVYRISTRFSKLGITEIKNTKRLLQILAKEVGYKTKQKTRSNRYEDEDEITDEELLKDIPVIKIDKMPLILQKLNSSFDIKKLNTIDLLLLYHMREIFNKKYNKENHRDSITSQVMKAKFNRGGLYISQKGFPTANALNKMTSYGRNCLLLASADYYITHLLFVIDKESENNFSLNKNDINLSGNVCNINYVENTLSRNKQGLFIISKPNKEVGKSKGMVSYKLSVLRNTDSDDNNRKYRGKENSIDKSKKTKIFTQEVKNKSLYEIVKSFLTSEFENLTSDSDNRSISELLGSLSSIWNS